MCVCVVVVERDIFKINKLLLKIVNNNHNEEVCVCECKRESPNEKEMRNINITKRKG
jgi:hypothetical protein